MDTTAPTLKDLERNRRCLSWAIDAEQDLVRKNALRAEHDALTARLRAMVAPAPVQQPAPEVRRESQSRLVLRNVGNSRTRGLVQTLDVTGPGMAWASYERPKARTYANQAWPEKPHPISGETLRMSNAIYDRDEWEVVAGEPEMFDHALTQGIVDTSAEDLLDTINDEPLAHTLGIVAPAPAACSFFDVAARRSYRLTVVGLGLAKDQHGTTYTPGDIESRVGLGHWTAARSDVERFLHAMERAPTPANTDPEPEPPRPSTPVAVPDCGTSIPRVDRPAPVSLSPGDSPAEGWTVAEALSETSWTLTDRRARAWRVRWDRDSGTGRWEWRAMHVWAPGAWHVIAHHEIGRLLERCARFEVPVARETEAA